MIEWNKRAKRDETQVAERRTWKSKCGHYKVVETNIKYGRVTDRRGNYQGYPVYYLAMRLNDPEISMWDIISDHRTRKAAVLQCEYFHEHGRRKPANTKAYKARKKMKVKRQARKAQRDNSKS